MNLIETVNDYWWMLKNYTPQDIRFLEYSRDALICADKVIMEKEVSLSGEAPYTNVLILSNLVKTNGTISAASFYFASPAPGSKQSLLPDNPRKRGKISFDGLRVGSKKKR